MALCIIVLRTCLKMHLRFAETSKHEANHGEVNHRLASSGLPFVVATESAITAQPTEGPLHDPASWQYLVGVKFGALHDFDCAAPQFARALQQCSGVASIGPDMFDASASLLTEEGRQQLLGPIPVLNVRWQDHHQQNQTDRVDQEVAFAPVDFLARIVTPLVAGLGTLDALAVDNRSAGLRLSATDQAQMFSQMGMNLVPQAVVLPAAKVVIDGAPRSKVFGQIPPLATGPDQIEDRVDQLSERMLAAATLLAGLGETIVEALPFGVGKIRCISHRKRIADRSTRYKLTLT